MKIPLIEPEEIKHAPKHILPNDIIEKMRNSIKSSSKEEEYCSPLCKKDGKIIIDNIIKGKSCSNIIRPECKDGEIPIGFFHVYPRAEYVFGTIDVRIGYQYGILCGEDKGKLLCFERRGDFNKYINDHMLSLIRSNYEQKQKLKRMRNAYFDKINITANR